jgi:hypothetical protein
LVSPVSALAFGDELAFGGFLGGGVAVGLGERLGVADAAEAARGLDGSGGAGGAEVDAFAACCGCGVVEVGVEAFGGDVTGEDGCSDWCGCAGGAWFAEDFAAAFGGGSEADAVAAGCGFDGVDAAGEEEREGVGAFVCSRSECLELGAGPGSGGHRWGSQCRL